MHVKSRYSFHDDYSEGAHPNVIEALSRTNMSQQSGYGEDEYCDAARRAIRDMIGAAEATIYFTPGGTGANLVSIASHLRPHEAVISAESGHIVGKEGGAIEAIGHKVLTGPSVDGKLTPETVQSIFQGSSEFSYQPKARMVFVSNATEIGTVYTKRELMAVAAKCKELNLLLCLDGARIGAALASASIPASEDGMTLTDIYNLTDVFWIGGTKNGALLGEAVVIKDPAFAKDFPYHLKQRGQFLAKGRILGIQFKTLMQDDLFFRLARHANEVAAEMSIFLARLGYKLWAATESNQVFVTFPPALVQELLDDFDFFIWHHLPDGNLVARLVASWATDPLEAKRLCQVVEQWTTKHQGLAQLRFT
ncbi:putative threonine aldolase [Lophiostoma macrostomum CBS 122681]|uniref:Putative threonine aldolase n=1 Tax=Lophiostoma macrostomum CBS 122681 TaxID=1314788 RepID=A0A6A6SR40_9PLEO|nr:putative threonine aldolase [Lophiostoma macrostomum CBS 122681]